jgi:hypothetical protein
MRSTRFGHRSWRRICDEVGIVLRLKCGCRSKGQPQNHPHGGTNHGAHEVGLQGRSSSWHVQRSKFLGRAVPVHRLVAFTGALSQGLCHLGRGHDHIAAGCPAFGRCDGVLVAGLRGLQEAHKRWSWRCRRGRPHRGRGKWPQFQSWWLLERFRWWYRYRLIPDNESSIH